MKKGFDYLFENTNELPPEIAEAVLEFKYSKGFSALMSKYKLHYDQAETLEDMTFRVMFSDMTPNEFTAKLVSELRLAPAIAKELTEDTNANIIDPVKALIRAKIDAMLEEYKDIPDSEVAGEYEEAEPWKEGKTLSSIYNEPVGDNHAIASQNIAHSTYQPIHNQDPLVDPANQLQKQQGTTVPAHDLPTPSHSPFNSANLTNSDVLHAIENPHPSFGGPMNSAIRTVSGTKSYSDVMAQSAFKNTNQGAPHSTPSIAPMHSSGMTAPIVKPLNGVDLLNMKGSALTVTMPTKTEGTVPNSASGKIQHELPTSGVDPYKEPTL